MREPAVDGIGIEIGPGEIGPSEWQRTLGLGLGIDAETERVREGEREPRPGA